MAILLEDLGNLNRIDKSLILYNNSRNNGKTPIMFLGDSVVTEKSRIEIDRITPHNFTTLMEKLDTDNSIAAIVVRAHGRQLCLVTKMKLYTKSSYEYFLRFSEYSLHQLKMNDFYSWTGFIYNDRPAPIKTAISRCVKSFYDNIAPEGTKKKWDTVIIYKDETVNDKINDRKNAKQGMIPNPGEEGYDDFISKLRTDFEKKCKEYIDKVRQNTTNKQEISEYLMTHAKVNAFKFNNYTYNWEDEDYARVGRKFTVTYIRNDFDNGQDYDVAPRKMKLRFNWKGFVPYLEEVLFTNDSYRYSSSNYEPLENLFSQQSRQ